MLKSGLYFVCLWVLACLSGCAINGYSKYYTDFTHKYGALDPQTYRLLQPGLEPQIMTGTHLETDSFSMQVKGYVPIGYSSFTGRPETVDAALEQARKIGATHVLVYSPLATPGAPSAPFTVYTPETVITTNRYRDSVVASPGPATGGYNAIESHRPAQAASYWIERLRWDLGAYVEDVPERVTRHTGLTHGCSLAIVVERSAAAHAGLYSGDIVVEFAGKPIADHQALKDAIAEKATGIASLVIYRDGKYLQKTVTFDSERNQFASQAN